MSSGLRSKSDVDYPDRARDCRHSFENEYISGIERLRLDEIVTPVNGHIPEAGAAM
jgi:hypothetical protein